MVFSKFPTMHFLCIAAFVAVGAIAGNVDVAMDRKKLRSIQMRTDGQIKMYLDAFDIHYNKGTSRAELQELAYKENVVERWDEKHRKGSRIMYKEEGVNYSDVKNPRKKQILESLADMGIHPDSHTDMETLKYLLSSARDLHVTIGENRHYNDEF
mmetsp:Transcript_5336/g.7004  ORF Transcript_5336/g.7004 Transcript_5336/m.7004 type:complete len:155 (-) Transcript_5336:156-620(-)